MKTCTNASICALVMVAPSIRLLLSSAICCSIDPVGAGAVGATVGANVGAGGDADGPGFGERGGELEAIPRA